LAPAVSPEAERGIKLLAYPDTPGFMRELLFLLKAKNIF